MGIHYAVEVSKGKNGDAFLKWMGGYFETNWSVNPVWTASITSLPDHPVARGVKPFTIKDEWYYHMRFVPGMVGVTPILAAVPPKSSLREDPQRGTNPTVAAEVAAGKPQVLAWAYSALNNGGRGFGFTGMHYHANLANDNLRTVLLNAVAWTAGLEVPKGGVPSKTPSPKELDQLIDEGKKRRANTGFEQPVHHEPEKQFQSPSASEERIRRRNPRRCSGSDRGELAFGGTDDPCLRYCRCLHYRRGLARRL